jgi:acetolactate synthase-1/2/3 large subunit
MNCAEMATLTAHNIPVLIVVFNNGALGMVRQWQSLFYEGRFSESTLSQTPDFVRLANAYGVEAFPAGDRDSFAAALSAALAELAAGRPALIDARVDRDEKVLPMVPSGKPIDEQIL